MSSEFDKNLEKYAELIIKVGLNLQEGQRLLIGTPAIGRNGVSLELAPLVRLIVKKAYQNGARLVEVMWEDDQTRLFRYQYAPKDSFEEYPTWRTEGAFNFAEKSDAMLFIASRDPDLLSEIDSNLILTSTKSYLNHMKPANDIRRKGLVNWSAIAAPLDRWADKIFPEIPQDERKARFWDVIFEICRVTQADPVAAWKKHINRLVTRASYLNNKQYTALHFIAEGTDLTIGLPKAHIWKSAHFTTQMGFSNVVNIPTEEIFTTPDKGTTEGMVSATKPLVTAVTIENLVLTFSKGKVVDVSASKGEEFIRNYIKTDEGASRLGEVSFVPHSSPISQSGLLFYNILIDENASCHIALGSGIKTCIENGVNMSDDEFSAAGGNSSMLHVDFMIGSEKMDVDGIMEDGTTEPIMRNGEWASKV
ncbi:MAG: aminopeptidase [Candidatus Lokiarchaeota archaeon]|nr:aminopeptidase [Candidatus Lokiarchaeota archaeon]